MEYSKTIKSIDLADNIIERINENIGKIEFLGFKTFIMTRTTGDNKYIR